MVTTKLVVKAVYPVVLFILISASFVTAQGKTPLYIFGDSLYDTGMTLYNGVKGAGAEFWPYGETFFGQPSGRFCDGRIIPDFIAQYAGLPYPKPYLLPGLKDYTKGVNFASAGACVLINTRPDTINLKKQVEYFQQMVRKLRKQVGQAKAKALLSKAVYLFNIGGNDYVTFLQNNLNKPLSSNVQKQYMYHVLGNLTTHIQTIYKEGARKFAFQSFAPVGCFPTFLQADGSCTTELNELAKMHNIGFAKMLKRLARDLPGFKYSLYDFYTALSLRLSNGTHYGFKETKAACCGSGPFNGKFTCMDKTNFTFCGTPSNHIWFDAGHPTEVADLQFAEEFWGGPSSLVAPCNVKSLFGER